MLLRAGIFPSSITHGFSTRHGGVSRGCFTSLNLGTKWGDDPESVGENLSRVAEVGEFSCDRLVTVQQVHGTGIVSAECAGSMVQADGIWASSEMQLGFGCAIAVRTADCVPLLVASGCGSYVAAVHSGWRGTVGNIAGLAVNVLKQAGAQLSDLRAAIGPCIEVSAFEVGEEVANQFPPSCVVRDQESKKIRVDLVRAVGEQLVAAGLNVGRIERVGSCTYTNPDEFYSYRRDGLNTGQHLSFIGWRSS